MKYAVIKIAGKQYKVSEGDEILVDKLTEKKPEIEILLTVDDRKRKIGTPKVSAAKVTFKVVNEEEKGKKLSILKYRAKSRYRRKMGFRPIYSRLLIQKIS